VRATDPAGPPPPPPPPHTHTHTRTHTHTHTNTHTHTELSRCGAELLRAAVLLLKHSAGRVTRHGSIQQRRHACARVVTRRRVHRCDRTGVTDRRTGQEVCDTLDVTKTQRACRQRSAHAACAGGADERMRERGHGCLLRGVTGGCLCNSWAVMLLDPGQTCCRGALPWGVGAARRVPHVARMARAVASPSWGAPPGTACAQRRLLRHLCSGGCRSSPLAPMRCHSSGLHVVKGGENKVCDTGQ
jgi:hypothetical protein